MTAAEVAQILQGQGRVLQNLSRFQRRDFIEEPSAGCVHEQAIAFHLEQPACLQLPAGVQQDPPVPGQPGGEALRAAIEDHVDVGVARLPGVLEEGRGA